MHHPCMPLTRDIDGTADPTALHELAKFPAAATPRHPDMVRAVTRKYVTASAFTAAEDVGDRAAQGGARHTPEPRTDTGRDPEPTATVIDAQSLRAAPTIPRSTSGWDGGKKVGGRKRHVVVDCPGLLLVVMVTAAGAVRHAGVPSVLRGVSAIRSPGWPRPALSRFSRAASSSASRATPTAQPALATTGSRGRVPASAGKPEATDPGGATATPCRQ
jgi:hypothetical protein